MFGTKHIIWLAIAFGIIVLMLLINRKKQLSLKNNLTILTVVLLISETIKTMSGISFYEEFGGYYLSPGCLPFHLCSIQIFFILYLRFVCKKESVKEKLLAFMYPTMLLGGVLAILIPTAGTEFLEIGPYQYFGYHIFIVYFALYLVLSKTVVIDFRVIARNIIYLVVLMVFGLWINSALAIYGVNFMFLTNPPMDNLPVLNVNHGWYIYFIHLITVGIILLLAVQLPFVFFGRSKVEKSQIDKK